MKNECTSRGFAVSTFFDANGQECSIQKSSAAEVDLLWLGCDHADPKFFGPHGWEPVRMPEMYVANTRMHLSRRNVWQLLPKLIKFALCGDI